MTGFGKGVAECDGWKITVEIKSLNSKQMDINVKFPGVFRELELEARTRIASRLERGKCDVTVTMENISAVGNGSLDLKRLAEYKKQIERMAGELALPLPADWYSVLLRMPDVYGSQVPELDEPLKNTLFTALDIAVEGVMQFRAKEGERLEEFFGKRIDTIGELLAEVPKYEGERIERIRARLFENLAKLAVGPHDPGRLEQEMIFYIEKLDVNEEKQRLAQHLQYFVETMTSKPGQGKKLGFIAQEMGREINTLGSKSNHAEMQCLVVKMKDELEQIKEQVLNAM